MVWTDLTVMAYIVSLIAGELAFLFITDLLGLASLAHTECPVCHKKFGNVFGLRKHIKKGEEKLLKAA